MNLLPDNSQRAKNITVAFYVFAFIQLVSVYSTMLQVKLLHRIQKLDFIMEEATANDQRQTMVVIVNTVAYIVCIILFILWFRRAYNNLNLSGRTSTDLEEGWAAGAWFVPFLNLGRPYTIMKEIWEKTQAATANLLDIKPAGIVVGWWALWLVSNITASISNVMFRGAEASIEAMITASYMSIAGDILQVIAHVVAIMMIKQTSAFEKNLQESLLNESDTTHQEGKDYLNFIT